MADADVIKELGAIPAEDTSAAKDLGAVPAQEHQVERPPWYQRSLVGESGWEIPSGAGTTVPAVTIPLSIAGKTVAGMAHHFTTPEGVGELGALATPAAPLVPVKWAVDMIRGGVQSAKKLGEDVADILGDTISRNLMAQNQLGIPPKLSSQEKQERIQTISEDAVNTALGIVGGVGLGLKTAGELGVKPTKTGALDAETIRRNKEVVPEAGQVPEGSQADSGGYVQQIPSGPPDVTARPSAPPDTGVNAVVPEPAPVGMGGAVPAEFKPTGQTATSIKNATVDAERAKRGLPPMMGQARRTWGTVWDQAMAAVDADPGLQDRLITDLQTKARPLTDLEDALLLHRRVDLKNEYEKATRDLAQAYDDGRQADVTETMARVADWSDRLQQLENVTKAGGRETARGLAARRMMANEDFTLAKMTLDKRAARGGAPLSAAETLEITKTLDKLKAQNAELQRHLAEKDQAAANAASTKTVAELKTKVAAERAQKRAAPTPNVADLTAQIAQKAKAGSLSELGTSIQKLARMFVAQGVNTRDALIDAVHSIVSQVVPGITRRDTMDAISGYGQYKQLTKDDISVQLRDLKGQMQQIGKLEDMASGRAPQKTGLERRTPSDEERRLIKQVEEKKRQGGYKVTDPATQLRTALQAVKTRLENQIKDLEFQIENRQKIVRQKTGITYDAEAEALRAKRDELRKQYDEIFPRQPMTDAQRLQAWKTRTTTRIDELQQRIDNKDFAPKAKRPPVKLDEEGIRLQANLERTKSAWEDALRKDQLANRSTWQKGLDAFVKWERAFKLSSPVVFGKLTAAAMTRGVTTATEEVVGAALGKLPVIRTVAKGAPREGGINVPAMAKALADSMTLGMKDAWQTALRGQSDLDVMFGQKLRDKDWANFFGQLHGMMKAPVKRAEFRLSLEKRIAFAVKNGVDVTDPMVQMRLGSEALADAYRTIFMQHGFSSDMFNQIVRQMESSKKYPIAGEIGARAARFFLPIVRVPANIVAETATGVHGTATASARVMFHVIRGTLKDAPPEVKDSIMRQFKKGSIGLGLMAIGYFSPNFAGGYDWREKRQPGAVKTGGFQIDGWDVPRWLTHAPWFELMQIGATIRHVKEQHVVKTGEEKGISEGMWAAGFGLLEETPFIGQLLRFDKLFGTTEQRNQYLGELARSTAIPQAVQWLASRTDKDEQGNIIKRKPENIWQQIQMGIPGLRQNVPEANPFAQ